MVPLLSSGTTGAAKDCLRNVQDFRHSCTASIYLLSILFYLDLIPPIFSLFTPVHVRLFSVILFTSKHVRLVLFQVLCLCRNYSWHPEPVPTQPALLRLIHPSFLRRQRPHSFSRRSKRLKSARHLSSFLALFDTRSNDVPLSDRDP